jgi:hypothetical protein
MPSKFNWYGDKVKAKVERETRAAMDSILADCVNEAKGLVHVKTSTLQGGIQMRPTKNIDGVLTGLWGVWDVRYAVYQELPIFKGSKPYLRPSADKHYPKLAAEIKRRMA